MSKKIITFDRNKATGPMTPFIMVPSSAEAESEGIISTFHNNRYIVFMKKILSGEFAVPDNNGNMQPMEIIHLIVARKDKKKTEIPWEEKQTIKNEILGPMSECVEIFPSEFRKIVNIVDYQTHLWGFPPGFTIPIGLFPKAVQGLAMEQALKNFSISRDELEVFVVNDEDFIQVFASNIDAKKSYEKSGNDMPDGNICLIGYIEDSKNIVWSDLAMDKKDIMLRKALDLVMLMDEYDDISDDDYENNPDKLATDRLLKYIQEVEEKEHREEEEEHDAEISLGKMRDKLREGDLFKKEQE